MALVEISTPLYWKLPKESGLARDMVSQAQERDMLDYALSQIHNYDLDTIFYSVDYCRERGTFYAIGPPLMNLKSVLLPIAARFSTDQGASFVDVECVPIQSKSAVGLNIRFMHVGALEQENLVLELTLANGLSKVFQIENRPKANENLIINTLQKDNEISWVIDWINYYRTYGVSSFHIYDNGSANFKNLTESLRVDISDDTNIKITKWPFNYGIAKLGQSLFTQKASILDFILQNQSTDWAINCDIDEYIYIPDEYPTLFDYFSSFDSDVGCVQFSSFDAPLVRGVSYGAQISIRDLIWRMRQHKEKYKNGFRPSAVVTPSVHFVNLKQGMKFMRPNEQSAFYIHALPLNTGWDQISKRQGHRRLDDTQIIKDERIVKRLDRA